MYRKILENSRNNKAMLAVLVDPDKESDLTRRCREIERDGADFIFIGSSLLMDNHFDQYCAEIKAALPKMPLIIFPGTTMQLSSSADAVLFLSLLSSRNAEMIIGKQVHAAPLIKRLGLEAISTAYLLIESGKLTSAQYMSHSLPLPRDKSDIVVAHAMAAEIMGFKAIYLEAGSGASMPVPDELIRAVRKVTQLPLLVGGGIKDAATAAEKVSAGANIVVVGNHFENEEKKNSLPEFVASIHGVKVN